MNHLTRSIYISEKCGSYKALSLYSLSIFYGICTHFSHIADSVKKIPEPYSKYILSTNRGLKDLRVGIPFMENIAKMYIGYDGSLAREYLSSIEEALKEESYIVVRQKGRLEYRLVYGVSGKNLWPLFEVGLEVDPVLNVPVVRGSALKGVFRAYLETIEREEKCAGLQNILKTLFGEAGENGGKGLLIFSDMFPVEPGLGGYILYPDVITPMKDKPKPKPIHFMAWQIGVGVEFLLAIHPSLEKKKDEIVACLKRALENMGVGARTSVGYGYVKMMT